MKRKVIAWLCVQFILVYAYFACPDSALAACEHYNNTVFLEDLNWVGAVPPGVGTAGWSGEGICPVCGTVCEPGRDLEAFTDPNAPVITQAPVATEAPVITEAPVATEAPVITEAAVATEAPVITEAPVVTQAPVATEAPVVTQASAVTEAPVITQAPAVTEAPVVTQASTVTEAPVITQEPAIITEAPVATQEPAVITEAPVVILTTEEPAVIFASAAPVITVSPTETETAVYTAASETLSTEAPQEPAIITALPEEDTQDAFTEELPVITVQPGEMDNTAPAQSESLPEIVTPAPYESSQTDQGNGREQEEGETQTVKDTNLSGSGGANYRRQPFSKDFPYRRMRFRPEQGIIIRRAGITVWPVSENGSAGSPLLNLLNR